MTRHDVQSLVADEYRHLAEFLSGQPPEAWDADSLCAGWRVREVVAHLTMAARYTPGGSAHFGISIEGRHLRTSDLDWQHGTGEPLTGPAGAMIATLSGRTIPEGSVAGRSIQR